MNVLIVVAHPDDEVLGCGGTAAQLARAGHSVSACILSGSVEARRNRPDVEDLQRQAAEASSMLGLGVPVFGPFPNIAFNAVPHLELVQFVESSIEAASADTLITHHPADLNDDHLQTSRACQAAARLSQRKAGVPSLEQLLFMEIPSSTDWAFPGTLAPFDPDTFFPIDDDAMELKLRALACYAGVMRPAPHPRSSDILRSLAAVRGAQAGTRFAEAFQTAFRRWLPERRPAQPR